MVPHGIRDRMLGGEDWGDIGSLLDLWKEVQMPCDLWGNLSEASKLCMNIIQPLDIQTCSLKKKSGLETIPEGF